MEHMNYFCFYVLLKYVKGIYGLIYFHELFRLLYHMRHYLICFEFFPGEISV